MSSLKSFAIVGGGIGGLTLAVAMQRKGFAVKVFEHASALKPLGAGLVLAPNAIKAYAEIGIADEVIAAGKLLKTFLVKDHHGKILMETNAEKLLPKFGVMNNAAVHRADLHRVLVNQLDPDTVVLGKNCIDVEQRTNGVSLQFSDGTTETADYVIASDGIKSVIRKKLLPNSTLRYAGSTCWRAVIDTVPASVDFEAASESWGPGCRFGIVPLTNNRIYWFACLNAMQNDPVMRSFRVTDLLDVFNKFHSPVTDVLKLTANENLIWSDINDLKPIRKFAFGKIVLMGDAAHATTPNMGQGACMAIEDAAVLANCLEDYHTPEEAFIQFECKRIKRTTRIVEGSWNLGKAAQLQNPLLISMRNAAVRMTPDRVAEQQLKFIHDISF
jgi:2-polyprenyl-6-methoxyphenol hydroxylase-like FAD-dependent oxidoreductase